MTDTPRRIRQRRTPGWRKPSGAMSVTRSSRWGNPFHVGRHGDPAAVVALYRAWIGGQFGDVLQGGGHAFRRPTVEQIRAQLAGRDLMCFCALDAPCHADVLLEMANR
jgi:hypothetical protein